MAELQRLSMIAWNEAPNLAPCKSADTCGRSYELIEYADAKRPWRELSRVVALEISKQGTVWLL